MSEQKYILVEDAVQTIRNNGVYGSGYSDSEREDDVVDMIERVHAYTPAEIMAGQWVPVTEETMPKEPYGCLLIVWDTPYDGGDDCLAYYPGFAGWDGTQWNDGDGQQVPFEVAYWMQLPPMPQPPKEADHDK